MKAKAEEVIEAGGADHEWLVSQNLAPYVGKCIAVSDRRIVAFGPTLREVLTRARADGVEPLCLRVPEGYVTV